MDGSDSNRDCIDRFLGRDLGQWRGLPARGCAEQDVATWFPLSEGWGMERRGAQVPPVEYRFRVLQHPAFQEGVLFYFDVAQRLKFIETEYWSFDAAECAGILAQLGPPPTTLDLAWRERMYPDSLLLYPACGLALGVVEHTGILVTVTAFAPCEVAAFENCCRRIALAREFGAPT